MKDDSTLLGWRRAVSSLSLPDGQSYFVHPTTGIAYGLNPTARVLLESIDREPSLAALAGQLLAAFDVSEEDARAGVVAFCRHMEELGIVELRSVDDSEAALRSRYLELLRRALVNLIYPEHELRIELFETDAAPAPGGSRERALRDIRYADPGTFQSLLAAKQVGAVWRRQPWRFSHTMVGMRRLEHLQWCAERVFDDRVPGDFLEAGVCQGGASILLRALQVAYGQANRRTWLADSFAGLPVPSHEADTNHDFSETRQPWLAWPQGAVEDNFRTYDLLSENVKFLPGWFRDTLAGAPVTELAILRLDADLYESTRDILDALYDRVSPGGFVVIDDYEVFVPCRRAIDEFRRERGVTAPLRHIDRMAVYWRIPF